MTFIYLVNKCAWVKLSDIVIFIFFMDEAILDSEGLEISSVKKNNDEGEFIFECVQKYWSLYMESSAPAQIDVKLYEFRYLNPSINSSWFSSKLLLNLFSKDSLDSLMNLANFMSMLLIITHFLKNWKNPNKKLLVPFQEFFQILSMMLFRFFQL